ncbi:hypothetical protein SAMN05192585_1292 [Acetanaerobacterium elongatum]|uniref:Uncharacterized protein n=1 Tax=Acetanaerobacterium elongatum TaxID=258515 RepID=A0A1H0DIQ6_9FIRM|nr:hypothetical protein SAMN05192585_1292 [Acetanaerobacterium elongatum]
MFICTKFADIALCYIFTQKEMNTHARQNIFNFSDNRCLKLG